MEGAHIVDEMMQWWMIPFELYRETPGFRQRISSQRNSCGVSKWAKGTFSWAIDSRPPKINMEPENDPYFRECHHFNRNHPEILSPQRPEMADSDRGGGGGTTEKESAAHEHDMIYVDVLDLGTSFKGTTQGWWWDLFFEGGFFVVVQI